MTRPFEPIDMFPERIETLPLPLPLPLFVLDKRISFIINDPPSSTVSVFPMVASKFTMTMSPDFITIPSPFPGTLLLPLPLPGPLQVEASFHKPPPVPFDVIVPEKALKPTKLSTIINDTEKMIFLFISVKFASKLNCTQIESLNFDNYMCFFEVVA
jgi:hypothetical protein